MGARLIQSIGSAWAHHACQVPCTIPRTKLRLGKSNPDVLSTLDHFTGQMTQQNVEGEPHARSKNCCNP